jgi:hypothetical protein
LYGAEERFSNKSILFTVTMVQLNIPSTCEVKMSVCGTAGEKQNDKEIEI